MKFKHHLARFLSDDRGQTTTEYILILAVVVLVASKFRQELLTRLTSILGNVGQKLDDATKDTP